MFWSWDNDIEWAVEGKVASKGIVGYKFSYRFHLNIRTIAEGVVMIERNGLGTAMVCQMGVSGFIA